MKKCNNCGILKELTAFYADAGFKDGKRNDCKTCKNESTYKWRKANEDHYNKSMRDYQAANPLQRDDCDLKRKYGKSRAWYDETLITQDNKCAICRKPNASTKRRLAVDHHHETGKVRGIVCYNCNRLLHAFDNIDLYNAIVAYLKKHQE